MKGSRNYPTYLPTYLPIYLRAYLPTYIPALPTYIPTYLELGDDGRQVLEQELLGLVQGTTDPAFVGLDNHIEGRGHG